MFYHTLTILFLSSNSQLRACYYRKLGSFLFFLLCALLIFICTKFYHLLDHPVNQQFKVFLQISPYFITPNNLVPLANCALSHTPVTQVTYEHTVRHRPKHGSSWESTGSLSSPKRPFSYPPAVIFPCKDVLSYSVF